MVCFEYPLNDIGDSISPRLQHQSVSSEKFSKCSFYRTAVGREKERIKTRMIDFSSETMQVRRMWSNYSTKRKHYQPRIDNRVNKSSKMMKYFLRHLRLKEFIASRPAL